MANYSFGDIDEIVCQHALGDFRFEGKSGESYTLDMGGIRANDDANQVTTGGKLMSQLNRVRGSFEGVVANDTENQAITDAAKLSGHPELGTWTISFNNGKVLKGKGRPVGDIQEDSNAGTFTLKIAAEFFEKI